MSFGRVLKVVIWTSMHYFLVIRVVVDVIPYFCDHSSARVYDIVLVCTANIVLFC